MIKEDTTFGELLNLAFKRCYGDDFEWERATISRNNGNYIVEIIPIRQRTIKSPARASPRLPLIQRIVKTAPPKRIK